MTVAAPKFTTLGCRLNSYESEAMKDMAQSAGLENAVIVNTCAVTAEAVRKSRQEIRRLRRENPEARIIVTGCAAQTEPETFAAMGEVDKVIGNTEKNEPCHMARYERRFHWRDRKSHGRRHHVSHRNRRPFDRRLWHTLACLCAGAKRL
jgi:tRNA A37 methylthiotransferase MiaB